MGNGGQVKAAEQCETVHDACRGALWARTVTRNPATTAARRGASLQESVDDTFALFLDQQDFRLDYLRLPPARLSSFFRRAQFIWMTVNVFLFIFTFNV